MATFTGTSAGAGYASQNGASLTNFTGGTLAELVDAIGDTFNTSALGSSIQLGRGNDTVNGGSGRDTIVQDGPFQGGTDVLHLGGGDDYVIYNLVASAAGDTIDGRAIAFGAAV